MKNFKASVPATVKTKINELAEFIQSNFRDVVTARIESMGDVQLSEIEGNYVSGWIPRQDGGFDVSLLVDSGIDSSYHVTKKQTEFVNEQEKNCFESFLSDNELDRNEMSWDDLTEEQKEEYCDYQNDWFSDGALIQIQMFASGYPGSYWEEKEQTITVRVSINYKDAPYFREKSAEDIKTLILSESEFLETSIDDIAKQITI
jgi:hypothetical protein